MKAAQLSAFQRWSILIGASVLLSLAMGMRQSFGLFQPSVIRDVGITSADFSFATALQNIIWGVTQPMVGLIADRYGTRWVMAGGVVVYAAGLVLMMVADSALMFTLGCGVCVGIYRWSTSCRSLLVVGMSRVIACPGLIGSGQTAGKSRCDLNRSRGARV
jgi:sugar phosphate permease